MSRTASPAPPRDAPGALLEDTPPGPPQNVTSTLAAAPTSIFGDLALLGDPCTSDEDCDGTWALSRDAADVIRRECDITMGECVAAAPPVVDDWGTSCTPGSSRTSLTVESSTSCGGGLCASEARGGCVVGLCTVRCGGDDDCPAGSICTPYDYGLGPDPAPAFFYCSVSLPAACP